MNMQWPHHKLISAQKNKPKNNRKKTQRNKHQNLPLLSLSLMHRQHRLQLTQSIAVNSRCGLLRWWSPLGGLQALVERKPFSWVHEFPVRACRNGCIWNSGGRTNWVVQSLTGPPRLDTKLSRLRKRDWLTMSADSSAAARTYTSHTEIGFCQPILLKRVYRC